MVSGSILIHIPTTEKVLPPVFSEDVGAASLNAANDLISVFGDTPLSTFLAKCAH
jgi:hypothetical protein